MVEATASTDAPTIMDPDQMTDDQFEAMAARMPKPTPEETERDLQDFINHPLNCREMTPEMMERPEFQALSQMAYDGTPQEVQDNFKHHAYESLGKLLLKKSKNEEKDFQEALYSFDQAIEQNTGNVDVEFDLYLGRAKCNILRNQCGYTKDDCLQALKRKPKEEQAWTVLIRSRFWVQKWDEASKYIRDASLECPNSAKLLELRKACDVHLATEIEKVKKIEIISEGKQDRMMAVYRNIREKGIRLGKRIHECPEVVDCHVKLDNRKKLHFPVLILYQEFMVTDFIQDWPEDETFATQLRPIFADQAPWDDEGAYRMDTIEVYFEADMTKLLDKKETPQKSNKKYIKCDLNSTLLEILKHPNYAVPQFPIFKIISRENDDFRDCFLDEI